MPSDTVAAISTLIRLLSGVDRLRKGHLRGRDVLELTYILAGATKTETLR
jgi:hypothetical protein